MCVPPAPVHVAELTSLEHDDSACERTQQPPPASDCGHEPTMLAHVPATVKVPDMYGACPIAVHSAAVVDSKHALIRPVVAQHAPVGAGTHGRRNGSATALSPAQAHVGHAQGPGLEHDAPHETSPKKHTPLSVSHTPIVVQLTTMTSPSFTSHIFLAHATVGAGVGGGVGGDTHVFDAPGATTHLHSSHAQAPVPTHGAVEQTSAGLNTRLRTH